VVGADIWSKRRSTSIALIVVSYKSWKNKSAKRGNEMSLFLTMTRKEFENEVKKVLETALHDQVEADQKVLDDAIQAQIQIDAFKDYKYFYTASLYILWKHFDFKKDDLNRFYDTLNDFFKDPPAYQNMVEVVNRVAEFDIDDAVLVEAKDYA
jgi:hypothetical protein